MTHRLCIGETQASALEINIFDPAHDETPFPGELLDGALLVDDGKEAEAAHLLTEAANGEDAAWLRDRDPDARAARDALSALALRVARLARS